VVPKDCQCTVFREPWLECGIPDLVIAVWHIPTVESWVDARAHVQSADLRVLQFLVHAQGCSRDELLAVYGPRAPVSLDRLCEARLIRRRGRSYEPAALSRTFGLRAIISVEAKMSDWRDAVAQAQRNLWFACSSYVLMPEKRAAQPRSGLGRVRFCTPKCIVLRTPLRRMPPTPRCYAVWLFNEWVWRTRHALPEILGGDPHG